MRRLIAGSILLGIIFVFLAVAAVPDRADAIPAFAREHNAPCTMCHVAFPKLNSFGIDFKQRGYRAEGQDGTSVWESKSIPLAGMVMFKYKNVDNEVTNTKESLIELDEVEFFAAGTLGPRVSYFMDFASEEGAAFAPGAAFIILDDLLPDSLLNLKAGAYDAEFPFLSNARRLTLRPYLVKIAPGTYSSTTRTWSSEGVSLGKAGAEVNGFHPAGFRYALGVGNDNATADNKVTALYAWATQSLPLAGQNQTIGVIYSSDRSGAETTTPATDDRTNAIGGVLDLHFGPANAILGYFTHSGNDKLATPERDTTSLLAELYYSISPQLEGVARYNYADNDDRNLKNTEYVLHLGYYFLPNASLGVEYSKRTDDDGTTELDTDRIQAAVHFGF